MRIDALQDKTVTPAGRLNQVGIIDYPPAVFLYSNNRYGLADEVFSSLFSYIHIS
jgi:hypothetical protein